MCELCELKQKAEEYRERLQFRLQQMQVLVQEGRVNEAQEVKRLAKNALFNLIDIVWQFSEKVRDGNIERHSMSLSDILGGGSSGGLH